MTFLIFLFSLGSYNIIFTVIYLVYENNERAVSISNAVALSIMIPFRLLNIYLLIYFWCIGKKLLNMIEKGYTVNTYWVKLGFIISFSYEVFSQVDSIFYWLYPSIMFYTGGECSQAFDDIRYFIVYVLHNRYFFQGFIILQTLNFIYNPKD